MYQSLTSRVCVASIDSVFVWLLQSKERPKKGFLDVLAGQKVKGEQKMREQGGGQELVPFPSLPLSLIFSLFPLLAHLSKDRELLSLIFLFSVKTPQNACYAGLIIKVQLEKFNATNLVTKHWLETAAKKLEVIPTLVNLQQQQNAKLSNY